MNQTEPNDGEDLLSWISRVEVPGAWFAASFVTCVILTIWYFNLYGRYPAVALRWTLYLECIFCYIVGPIKWWTESAFYAPLVTNPTLAGCLFTVTYDTFLSIGIVFSATVSAFALYELTSNGMVLENDEAKLRRKEKLSIIFFWIFTLGFTVPSVATADMINGWCMPKEPVLVAIKLCVVVLLIVAQVVFVILSFVRLARMNFWMKVRAATMNEQQEGEEDDGEKPAETRPSAMPPSSVIGVKSNLSTRQQLLAVRFFVLVMSEFLGWLPLIYAEFLQNFSTGATELIFRVIVVGVFVGPIFDGLIALVHPDLYGPMKRWVGRNSRTSRVVPSTTKALTDPKEGLAHASLEHRL